MVVLSRIKHPNETQLIYIDILIPTVCVLPVVMHKYAKTLKVSIHPSKTIFGCDSVVHLIENKVSV